MTMHKLRMIRQCDHINRILIYVLSVIMPFYIYANEEMLPKQFWVNGGLSIGRPGDFYAPQASFTYRYGNRMISVRCCGTWSFDEPVNINDIGVLCGLSKKTKLFLLGGGIGVSYVKGYNFNSYESGITIGIPVEMQTFVTPFKFVGVGVYWFGNFNLKRNFYGAALCLQIGKLR